METQPLIENKDVKGCGYWVHSNKNRVVFSSIRMIPRGKTKQISVALQPSIRFYPPMARNGPFQPFFGPQGSKVEVPLLVSHPEGAMPRPSRVHQGYPGGPKRARFGPKCPFWGPRRSSESPGRPDLVPTAPIGPAGLNSWSQRTLTWYQASSGP